MTALAGKRAIVVGGSSGIGRAVVERLLARDMVVYSLSRRSGPSGAQHDRQIDVTHAARVTAEIDGIVAEGDIDVVIYSAGWNVPERRFDQLSVEDWDAMIAANLSGAFYVARACLPSLRRTQGLVILVSSASAIWTNQSGPSYQAAKVGLMGMARAGNFEENGNGVRFTTIFPGLVDTLHLDRRPKPPDPDVRAKSLRPDDVAAVCELAASLPASVCIPEVVLLPTYLQSPGKTAIT